MAKSFIASWSQWLAPFNRFLSQVSWHIKQIFMHASFFVCLVTHYWAVKGSCLLSYPCFIFSSMSWEAALFLIYRLMVVSSPFCERCISCLHFPSLCVLEYWNMPWSKDQQRCSCKSYGDVKADNWLDVRVVFYAERYRWVLELHCLRGQHNLHQHTRKLSMCLYNRLRCRPGCWPTCWLSRYGH